VGPGSTPALPGRHTHFLAGIHILGPEYDKSGSSLARIRGSWAVTAIPAGLGRHSGSPMQARASSPGWAGSAFVPAGPSRPLCGCFARPFWPPRWAASAGCLGSPRQVAGPRLGSYLGAAVGWADLPASQAGPRQEASASFSLAWAALCVCALRWAASGQVWPASGARDRSPGHGK
jgi:hypothetical protein